MGLDPLHRGRLPAAFERRAITLAPGATRPYDEAEWHDALVTVESGELHLECLQGGRRSFAQGSVLWFTGLGLRALHNLGTEPLVVVAVRRAGAQGASRSTSQEPPSSRR